jgi:GNAT superfamily N-acetyltransferase
VIGSVERLTLDDLAGCLALAQDRDWQAEEHKWRLLFEVGNVLGLRDDSGEVIGTTVLTRYGSELAAVSMVLVAERHGGSGLGRRLMTQALSEAGDAVVFLNATEHGRPLYEKVGFVPVGLTHTFRGDFAPAPDRTGSRPATPLDLPGIAALDAAVMGADRGRLIECLPGFAEQLRVIERDDVITGYAGAWRNVANAVIGPVIAASVDDAVTLIADTAGTVAGPVRIDLDESQPALRAWVTSRGLVLRYSEPLMVRHGRRLPGDRSRWFAPLTQSLG